jgi:hypothetical protein
LIRSLPTCSRVLLPDDLLSDLTRQPIGPTLMEGMRRLGMSRAGFPTPMHDPCLRRDVVVIGINSQLIEPPISEKSDPRSPGEEDVGPIVWHSLSLALERIHDRERLHAVDDVTVMHVTSLSTLLPRLIADPVGIACSNTRRAEREGGRRRWLAASPFSLSVRSRNRRVSTPLGSEDHRFSM